MRAAVIERYGPPHVVRIADLPSPAPRAGEIVVRVAVAAVTAGDARIRGARFPKGFGLPARLAFGLRQPRWSVLGSAFSGWVEAVGTRVTDLAVGDEVCGMTGARLGAHAEYAAVAAERVVRKPAEVTHEDAAGVLFGGTAALYFLRDRAAVHRGQSVLVNGASGAIGTNAVQLATHYGAVVTGVTSGPNTSLVRDLGADRVIDYTVTDLGILPDRFDVVLDTVGNLSPGSGRRLLTETGALLLAVADLGETIRARSNVKAGVAPERAEDFDLLVQLVAKGELSVVLDQVYDLAEIAAAHQRVDSGHKVGNVLVRP
jgi:NADPH:quinone reductase-like Zn-dependent oxidoreductase